ncbi:hypothetical protein K4K55_000432 [Colletotrichum sp. SAR 10_96]|nr:hypothetical protein K4K55_000432 [Colletotrichum sp. SAR 10_96]
MAPKPNVEFGRLTINLSNDLNSPFQILNPRQGIATIDSLTRTVGACHGPRAQAHAMLDKVLNQAKGDIVTFMYSILPTASIEADSQQIARQQTVKVEQPPSLPLRDIAPLCTYPPNMSIPLQPTCQPQGPVYDVHDVNMPYSQPQGPGHPTAMGMPLGYNLQAPSYPGTTIPPLGLEVPKDSIENDDQRNVRAPSIRLKRESSEALGRTQPPPSRRDHHEDHRPHNPPHGRPSRHRSHGQYRHNPVSVSPARRPQARTDTSRSLPKKTKPNKDTHPLLGQDEWTKRDGENRDLTCGNCGLRGHILLDCLWPDQDGWIQACPLCNSKEHHLEGCDRMQRLTERDMFDILVLRRANKLPLKTTEAWIEWVMIALERRWIQNTYTGFPNMADACKRMVRSVGGRKQWVGYDYSNDSVLQRTELWRDDTNAKQMIRRDALRDECWGARY